MPNMNLTHLEATLLLALLTSVVLGVVSRKTNQERLHYGLRCFGYFLAAVFGLGWGAVECALVAVKHVSELSFLLKLYGSAAAVPMPFAPLLVTAERLGAILLHVSLAAFAAAAAMALARKNPSRAALLFGAAVALHTLLDAWIRVMFVRYPLEQGAAGPLVTIAGFVAGGALALVLARRIRPEGPVTSGAAAPAV